MTTVVVTGANRGIGAALLTQGRARGWTMIGTAREGGDLTFDVTDHDAVRTAAASLDGPVDVLINNAGIIGPERQTTGDMDYAGFAETLAVNTLAPLAVSQAFLPALKRSDRGRILTISSQMSRMSYAKSDTLAYRASKAAVNKVMQGLSTDLAPVGIPVALINPGWVRTDMGGGGADEDPLVVADGILDVADGLTMERTGKLITFKGEVCSF